MISIHPFWKTLDALPGLSAAKIEWQRQLGDDFDFVKGFLRPTGQLVESIPRPEQLPLRVVCHGPEDYVAVSPEGDRPIKVNRDDLLIYELHLSKLANAVAKALKLDKPCADVDGMSHTWKLGNANQPGKKRHPVFMSFHLEDDEYKSICSSLGHQYPDGFIFLSPLGQPHGNEYGQVFSLGYLFGFTDQGTLKNIWAGNTWLVDAPVPYVEAQKTEWPDPAEKTMVIIWTTKDGAFHIRAKHEQVKQGRADFPLNTNGALGKQASLLQLLAFKHPGTMTVGEILQQVYPDETKNVQNGSAQIIPLIKKCRSLFSDLKTKLKSSDVNPKIIPPLSQDAVKATNVALQVSKVRV